MKINAQHSALDVSNTFKIIQIAFMAICLLIACDVATAQTADLGNFGLDAVQAAADGPPQDWG